MLVPEYWPSAPLKLRIIIVGAGLGGLACAIQCRLAGHEVTILEQAKEIGEIGAGIQIPPQTSRIFQSWGIMTEMEKYCVTPSKFVLRRYSDGKELSVSPVNDDDYVKKTYGSPYWVAHRADFHRVLSSKAQAIGVKLQLGASVDGLEEIQTKPIVVLRDGQRLTADLVVACDGIKSRTREILQGKPDPPVDTGDIAYRILIPASEMRKHEELRVLVEGDMSPLNYWMGPDSHVVCYLLKGADLYNIVLIRPDTLPKGQGVAVGDVKEMQAVFEGWDHRLRLLLTLVKDCAMWKLQNHDELDRWAYGKVVLLGDACHPTLPYLASGAAMAIEDGAVLGRLLAKIADKTELAPVLQMYEALRKPRTTTVVRRSTWYRKTFHLNDGLEQEARDRMFDIRPFQEGCPNQWADPSVASHSQGPDANICIVFSKIGYGATRSRRRSKPPGGHGACRVRISKGNNSVRL